MFCTNCGNQLQPDARFCGKCGTPTFEAAPSASTPSHSPTVASPQPAVAPPAAGAAPSKLTRLWISLGKRSRILLLCAAAVVLVAAVWGGSAYSKHQEYQSEMETGLRFLNAGQYEEAVLAFETAINIEPRRADAYVGLADAYTGLEDFDSALSGYLAALSCSNAPTEAYLGLANTYLELGDIDSAFRTLEQGYRSTGDPTLLTWANALDSTNGTSALNGVVSEYLPGGGSAPLADAKVRLYLTLNGRNCLLRSATTLWDGTFLLSELPAGTYALHVDAPGHLGIQTEETLAEGEMKYTEVFLLIPETESVLSDALGELYIQAINPLNGEPIPNARASIRTGWNNQQGNIICADQFTDSLGECWFYDLDYGYYTVELSADEYMSAYHNVAVLPNEFDTNWSLYLNPVLSDGEARIVLTWNETPSDLDSHLIGSDFHIYYGNMDYHDDLGRHRVNLDLDDTSSYGPETITILQTPDEAYTYSVYDYSNGGREGLTDLSYSGATVRVYQGEGLTAEYHVPVGVVGYTWDVFRIYPNGTIESLNAVGEWYPGSR